MARINSIFREIMKEEIKKGECEVCGFLFTLIIIHHKDGNEKNNKKQNLIAICSPCHKKIHNGLKTKDKNLDEKTKERILNLRGFYLLNKRGYSQKEVQNKINSELWLIGYGGYKPLSKDKCVICKKKKKLIYFVPEFVKEFEMDEKKIKKGSMPICKDCLKSL
jgi:hypothetical protein